MEDAELIIKELNQIIRRAQAAGLKIGVCEMHRGNATWAIMMNGRVGFDQEKGEFYLKPQEVNLDQ